MHNLIGTLVYFENFTRVTYFKILNILKSLWNTKPLYIR